MEIFLANDKSMTTAHVLRLYIHVLLLYVSTSAHEIHMRRRIYIGKPKKGTNYVIHKRIVHTQVFQIAFLSRTRHSTGLDGKQTH